LATLERQAEPRRQKTEDRGHRGRRIDGGAGCLTDRQKLAQLRQVNPGRTPFLPALATFSASVLFPFRRSRFRFRFPCPAPLPFRLSGAQV